MKRSTSPRKSDGTKEYSCTLYKDYLVFFGGRYDGKTINHASVYNLKEGRMDKTNNIIVSYPRYGHSACLYEPENQIILFGGLLPADSNLITREVQNATLQLEEGGGGRFVYLIEDFLINSLDGLYCRLTYGLLGPPMPSPVCSFYGEKIYVYQANEENGNFGELRSFEKNEQRWHDLRTSNGNIRLRVPSQKAIFVQNKLYLFTETQGEQSRRNLSPDSGLFEDVYVLDLNREHPEWEKILSSSEAPGIMTNTSMVEADGVIYIFGSSHEGEEPKSVLWAFDTDEEKWKKVQDIGTLTVRPNQKVMVYKGKLLIVDWDYANQLVQTQYQNLNEINFVHQSSNSKDICKEKPEYFIQDMKNLYDGRLFSDVIFEIESEQIPAHKSILASRSDYFMKMFTSGMSESHSAKISIPNMKSHIFKAILQYIYCNEVELDEQLALDLIPTVDEYVMKGLKGLCEKYLCKQLRKDNVVDMLIVADRHEIEELKKACFKFILKNLDNIDENGEMMKLSKSLFIELLKFNTPCF